MDTAAQQKRNRIIALAFASVLLLLMYGPLAQWFIAADRVLYDQLAGGMPNQSSENTFIASIDAVRASDKEVLDQYGAVLEVLQNSGVRRIILANPPVISESDELPGWTALIDSPSPVFVPTRHRLSSVASRDGFVGLRPDSDNVLRRSELWQLNNGIKSPSLSVDVGFEASESGS